MRELNLSEISQEQEELYTTYIQNEARYSSQQMMDNAIADTTEALVTEMIPFDLLPHLADEILDGAQTVESIPGVVGTLKNTRNALIWKSQGRNQNRDAWSKLEILRQGTQTEYKAADLDSQRISALIESAQLGMSRASEAMNGRL
jgi:thiazole synthase ThiGH ThiG subunit